MHNISRDYHSERMPSDPKLRRDTDILQGRLSFEQRLEITRRWSRAGKLGALAMMRVKANRDAKRGFEA